jgi:ribosomal peptide maturation radical SAM protein 1
MPFAQYKQPSIALSLLKAELAERGFRARVAYPNLRFAERIGAEAYERIAAWYPADLLGDWLFAPGLGGPGRDDEGYLEQVLRGRDPAHTQAYFGKRPVDRGQWQELLAVRAAVPAFLDACAREILAAGPRIVGFTSQFHQHTAVLSLARLLKARRPDLFVAGGGANFRGPMGQEAVLRFPWLDAVVSGEGDLVFPDLVARVLAGQPVADLPGVFTPGLRPRPEPAGYAPPATDLDRLPAPDTLDFQAAWAASGFAGAQRPRYLLETSRGCWWGARHRCLFCGQGSARLDYRAKSPGRAAAELGELGRTHPDSALIVTDEIISPTYFDTFLPELARLRLGDRIIYFEVRPNLTREQLARLRLAGVGRVEAGIESLSTPVLALVRKGVSALQCLQFLKWCRELGLTVVWNWLWGFPGEPASEYRRLAGDLGRLFHLAPPNYAGPFRLDRFSPYFEQPRKHRLEAVAPYPAYRHVYPLPPEALERLAYYFTYRIARPHQEVDRYTEPLAEQISRWKAAYPEAALAFVDEGDRLVLQDRREPGRDASYATLDGSHRLLYLACDRARSAAGLCRILQNGHGEPRTPEAVRSLLAPLVDQGWMAQEGDGYLSLAYRRRPADGTA